MNATHESPAECDGPGQYEIRIRGHLNDRWADWFDGLTITREDSGETLLRGLVVDQAALHGLLRNVRDLGLTLLSVILVGHEPPSGPNVHTDMDHDRLNKDRLNKETER